MTDTASKPDRNTPATGRAGRSEKAILEAAEALIAERGVDGRTIEGVAARAGVAKTTSYRRWRDKEELALAILVDTTAKITAPPDVGDTRKELLTFVRTAKRVVKPGGIVRELASAIATKPHLSRTYRERIVDLRLAEIKTVIDRGIARGDLRPDPTWRLAHEMLIGPLFYRLLFSGAPLDNKHANEIVDAVMRAFSP